MPSHGHTASTDTININGGFRLDGTEIGGTTSASGVFSIGSSFTPSKGHGNSGGGSNAGRNINFNSTHSHKITINNVGEGQSHNNIQPVFNCLYVETYCLTYSFPYIYCNIWLNIIVGL